MGPDSPLAPGLKRVALGVEYEGTRYCGWQTQPDAATVQDALERAASKFVTHPVQTICAGRTDAGVHALSQVVHMDVDCERGEANWVRGINTFLPQDIAVRWAREVDSEFSARFSALSRTYEYWILNDAIRAPSYATHTGWVWRPLDASVMHRAGQALLGEHDFTSFRSADCQAASPVRTIQSLCVRRFGKLVGIRIRANAFLQHMVRNIVGTLVYVGTGREAEGWVKEVLQAQSRSVAAPTFAATGLYLTAVQYPEKYGLPSVGKAPFLYEWDA